MNDDGSPAFSPLEVGFFLWALTHGLDELHQFFKNRARDDAHFDDQGWCAHRNRSNDCVSAYAVPMLPLHGLPWLGWPRPPSSLYARLLRCS